MTLIPNEESRARARAECEAIWHEIAAAALRARDVDLAYWALVEYAYDLDRIAAS